MLFYIFLLVIGANATWKVALKVFPTSADSLVGVIVVFVLLFLIVGPIIGVITLVKMGIQKMKEKE